MSAKRGIKQSGEALVILLVHPNYYLLFVIFFVQLFLATFAQSLSGFLHEKSDDVEMPLEGQLVEYGICLTVFEVDQLQFWVLFEVIIDLIYFSVVEEQLNNLAFFASSCPLRFRIHFLYKYFMWSKFY